MSFHIVDVLLSCSISILYSYAVLKERNDRRTDVGEAEATVLLMNRAIRT